MFENYLKQQNPQQATINYDVNMLFAFIDNLSDLSCLVFQVKKFNFKSPTN